MKNVGNYIKNTLISVMLIACSLSGFQALAHDSGDDSFLQKMEVAKDICSEENTYSCIVDFIQNYDVPSFDVLEKLRDSCSLQTYYRMATCIKKMLVIYKAEKNRESDVNFNRDEETLGDEEVEESLYECGVDFYCSESTTIRDNESNSFTRKLQVAKFICSIWSEWRRYFCIDDFLDNYNTPSVWLLIEVKNTCSEDNKFWSKTVDDCMKDMLRKLDK